MSFLRARIGSEAHGPRNVTLGPASCSCSSAAVPYQSTSAWLVNLLVQRACATSKIHSREEEKIVGGCRARVVRCCLDGVTPRNDYYYVLSYVHMLRTGYKCLYSRRAPSSISTHHAVLLFHSSIQHVCFTLLHSLSTSSCHAMPVGSSTRCYHCLSFC